MLNLESLFSLSYIMCIVSSQGNGKLNGCIYDPAVGDPDNGIAVNTIFVDLSDDRTYPEYGVSRDEFEPLKE